MPYSVPDDRDLAELKPGAYVDFTLVVGEEVAPMPKPSTSTTTKAPSGSRCSRAACNCWKPLDATLQPGDAVPDFTLTDQTGRRVTLSQFAGKVVAMTFIYTSCPLPDYCFRLSNNFGQLNQRFASRMGRDLVLLSISFDPAHDQPDVLAKYAPTWKADPRSLALPHRDARRSEGRLAPVSA